MSMGVVMLLAGVFFGLRGVVGLFGVTNSQQLSGSFVADECVSTKGHRYESTAYACSGTFTPTDTALQPVDHRMVDSEEIHASTNLDPGVAYPSYALVPDLYVQPTATDDVLIVGDGNSESGPRFLGIENLILGVVLLACGIGLLIDLHRGPAPRTRPS